MIASSRLALGVAAAASLASGATAQDERPTGAPASANERRDGPVALSAVYTAEVRANARGGIARGVRYLDNVDLQLAIDTERLVGWRGARLFFYAIHNNGVAFSSTLVGDIQTVSNIETGVRATRLFEAWVEQRLSDRASIKFGLYNLNAEFDTTQSGALFLLSSHGIGPDLSQSGESGPSIFPVTSLAVRGEVALAPHSRLRFAVLDATPGDPRRPRRTAVSLSAREGALVVAEVDRIVGGTKLAAGAWGYSARFDTIAGARSRGNKGAYLLAEHRRTGEQGDDPVGLAGWVRVGVADARFNPIGHYAGAGIVQTGTVAGRADDQIGVSVGTAWFGDRYRRAEPARRDRRETVFEAAYLAPLAPWLSLQPDLQYIVNPGGDPARRDAVVVALRVKIGR